jgi:hypothetical protein
MWHLSELSKLVSKTKNGKVCRFSFIFSLGGPAVAMKIVIFLMVEERTYLLA